MPVPNHIQTTNHKLVRIDLKQIMYLQYVYIRRPFSMKETLREDKNISTLTPMELIEFTQNQLNVRYGIQH